MNYQQRSKCDKKYLKKWLSHSNLHKIWNKTEPRDTCSTWCEICIVIDSFFEPLATIRNYNISRMSVFWKLIRLRINLANFKIKLFVCDRIIKKNEFELDIGFSFFLGEMFSCGTTALFRRYKSAIVVAPFCRRCKKNVEQWLWMLFASDFEVRRGPSSPTFPDWIFASDRR